MKGKSLPLVSLCVVLAVVLAGCTTDEPTATPTTAPTATAAPTATPKPSLGSAERPIQVYFVPSVEAEPIVTGGAALEAALETATGLEFEVYVPTSYGAFVEGMCAAGEDAMGFPATTAYVVANARCGVDASMISVRYGDSFYYGGFIVPRESPAQTLADLDGLTWGYGDVTSTSGYIVPSILFPGEGIEPGRRCPHRRAQSDRPGGLQRRRRLRHHLLQPAAADRRQWSRPLAVR